MSVAEGGDRVAVACSACQATMRVPAAAVGKRAKCPKCSASFRIEPLPTQVPREPAATTPAQSAEARGELVRFTCDTCGTSLKVPVTAAGRRVKCRGCSAVLTVPTETRAAPPPPPPPAVSDDDLLGQLGAGEAVETVRTVATKPCPHCDAPMPALATTCPACGKKLSTKRKEGGGVASAALGALSGASDAGNRFAIGVACSFVGGLIGGGIWFGVAYATQYEIGWLAWAVGGLTGLGMYAGMRQGSFVGGVVAAGIAVAAIVGAKYFIVAMILASLFGTLDEDPRETWANHLAAQAVEQANSIPEPAESASDAEWEAYEAKQEAAHEAELVKAREAVAKLSDGEVREKVRVQQNELKADMQKTFFRLAFDWHDLIFFGLAVVTAFKLGAGGPTFNTQ